MIFPFILPLLCRGANGNCQIFRALLETKEHFNIVEAITKGAPHKQPWWRPLKRWLLQTMDSIFAPSAAGSLGACTVHLMKIQASISSQVDLLAFETHLFLLFF